MRPTSPRHRQADARGSLAESVGGSCCLVDGCVARSSVSRLDRRIRITGGGPGPLYRANSTSSCPESRRDRRGYAVTRQARGERCAARRAQANARSFGSARVAAARARKQRRGIRYRVGCCGHYAVAGAVRVCSECARAATGVGARATRRNGKSCKRLVSRRAGSQSALPRPVRANGSTNSTEPRSARRRRTDGRARSGAARERAVPRGYFRRAFGRDIDTGHGRSHECGIGRSTPERGGSL